MTPPAFWQRPANAPGIRATLLAPLSALYSFATARRVARPAKLVASVPVICVGNLNVGGTGKTPTAIAICARLRDRNLKPHFVSRGYGGQLTGPVQVSETAHDPAQVGDEPLLLAAFAPTWVSKDRAAGVEAAQNAGAGVIILDDGFQNPDVAKDYSIVVVDARRGYGNGRVLPAGPLREPVNTGLSRADCLLTIGSAQDQELFTNTWPTPDDLPHCRGVLAPLDMGMDWNGVDLLAFAGIGDPEKFFRTLRGLGARVVRTEPLADHQPLTASLMHRLKREADATGSQLVTTEKDAARLPRQFRQDVLTLPVRLQVDDWTPIDDALNSLGLDQRSA